MWAMFAVLTPIALSAGGYFNMARKVGANIPMRVVATLIGGAGFIGLFLMLNQMIEVVTRNFSVMYQLLMTMGDFLFIVVFSFIPSLLIMYGARSLVRGFVTPKQDPQ
jgi:hypothetical protein